jgi:competence protein ComFC
MLKYFHSIPYMRFFNTILDIIFPTKCLSCGKTGMGLCLACLQESPPAENENTNWIFSVYNYHHPPVKKALQLFKYKNKKRLANIFAEVVYEKILEELSELSVMENFREPLLLPIPLSAQRNHERGYNQAQLICEELVRLSKKNHLTPNPSPYQGEGRGEVFTLEKNILIKTKETEHQARIKNRNARLKNIVGSFAVKDPEKNKIKNRNIILIDDITTTGATLTEAKKVLKQAGAGKVIAFTVAH